MSEDMQNQEATQKKEEEALSIKGEQQEENVEKRSRRVFTPEEAKAVEMKDNAWGCGCFLSLVLFLVAFFVIKEAPVKTYAYIAGSLIITFSIVLMFMNTMDSSDLSVQKALVAQGKDPMQSDASEFDYISTSSILEDGKVPAHLRTLMTYQNGLKVHIGTSTASMGQILGVIILSLGGWLLIHLAEKNQWPIWTRFQSYHAFFGFVGLAGLLIGVIAAVVAVVNAVKYSRKKVTKFSCPNCGRQDSVFQGVKKFACLKCYSVLLLSPDGTHQPQQSPCPNCDYVSYVAQDYGEFNCPDCGVLRKSGSNEIDPQQKTCSSCNAVIPHSALYCKNCNTITSIRLPITNAADKMIVVDKDKQQWNDIYDQATAEISTVEFEDPYWIESKSTKGRIFYAMTLLNSIRNDASFVITDQSKLGIIYKKLGDIMIYLKQPVRDYQSAPDPVVKNLLSKAITLIDITYAELIRIHVREAEKLFTSDRKVFENDAKGVFYKDHMFSREGLLQVAGKTDIPLDVLDKWESKLIDFGREMDFGRGVVGNKDEYYYKDVDLTRLRDEARRLKEWTASKRI